MMYVHARRLGTKIKRVLTIDGEYIQQLDHILLPFSTSSLDEHSGVITLQTSTKISTVGNKLHLVPNPRLYYEGMVSSRVLLSAEDIPTAPTVCLLPTREGSLPKLDYLFKVYVVEE